MKRNETKQLIKRAALQVAIEKGVEAVTPQAVAEVLQTTRQKVGNHYSQEELRAAAEAAAFEVDHPWTVPVMAHAITGPRSARYHVTADQLARVSAWIMRGRVNAR